MRFSISSSLGIRESGVGNWDLEFGIWNFGIRDSLIRKTGFENGKRKTLNSKQKTVLQTSIEILTLPPSPFSTISNKVFKVRLLPLFSTREM